METSAQENVVLSQNQSILPEQPKQNNFLVILLSVLLLLSVSIAGFFAYQTQTLVKELTLLKSSPTPVSSTAPTSDPIADWKTYTNTKFDFELRLPTDLQVTEIPVTRIGNKISIYSTTNDPEACRGDCHIIDKAETKIINGISTRYLTGWWGDIGGNIAQSYVSYVIPINAEYLIIQIQELPFDAKYIDSRKVQSVDKKELDQFDQILSTFKFTTSDPTANWKTYTNEKFVFKYPTNVTVSFKTQGQEEIIGIKGLSKDVVLVVDPIEDHNFYLDKQISKTIKYNNVSWSLLTGPQQYCDGGECSSISDALQVEYKNKRYSIVLGDLIYPDSVLDQILSTFKFID